MTEPQFPSVQPNLELMITRRALGYVIVLVGVAGFVLGCFLPYTSFRSAHSTSEVSISYYRSFTAGKETPQYVAGLLWLFGGAGIVAWIAVAGLRLGHHARRQAPSNLVAATLVWSLPWIGALLSVGRPRVRGGPLDDARQRRCGRRRHTPRLGLRTTDGA